MRAKKKKVRVDQFEIKTWDLMIIPPGEHYRGSWSFKYQVKLNGKIIRNSELESTYTVETATIRSAFRRGHATVLVLESL